MGLTCVQTNDPVAWGTYESLHNAGELHTRVLLTAFYDELGADTLPPPHTFRGILKFRRIKVFADGSLGAETAALR